MREIKFRGKSFKTGKMVYGFLIIEESTKCFIHWTENDEMKAENVIPETVGQYTGLPDKNGKDIYEGDIVDGGKGEIFYCDKSAMFKVRWHDKIYKNVRCCNPSYNNGEKLFMNAAIAWEVIGNIYENPELLK